VKGQLIIGGLEGSSSRKDEGLRRRRKTSKEDLHREKPWGIQSKRGRSKKGGGGRGAAAKLCTGTNNGFLCCSRAQCGGGVYQKREKC